MNPVRDSSASSHAPSVDEWLSALADGHGDDDAVKDACRHWRGAAEVRQTWHTYQLIGDVMRTDELASTPSRDAAFLMRLRARLDDEPVPLAPEPIAVAAQPRHRRWLPPVAAVAGFVAVGAAVVVLRPEFAPRSLDEQASVASVEALGGRVGASAQVGAMPAVRIGAAARSASAQPVLILDGQSVRDASLEVYFEAHRGALGPAPVALPGGALRAVEDLQPLR